MGHTLVTGGAGYIGSVTVQRLVAAGRKVVVLDDLARGHRTAVPSDVPLIEGRVGDTDLVRTLCTSFDVEAVIHFAALAYVGESVQDPRRYFENNVIEGLAFLGSLLDVGVRRFVFSSTCATYGEPDTVPIAENQRQSPTNPYGFSKLVIEQALAAYGSAYDLTWVSLRYFNACGATDHLGEHHEPETHLIPIVLETAAGRRPFVPVLGEDYPTPDGTAIRDYIHVCDLADAHVAALDHLSRQGPSVALNLGTGVGHSVRQVIDTARTVTGRPIPVGIQARRPGDPARLVADPRRAAAILGWKARMSDLESVIKSAWAWHQRFPHGYVESGTPHQSRLSHCG